MSLIRKPIPVLDRRGTDARVYERPNPTGPGRQVVKESVLLAERKKSAPQIFPDQSRISIRNEALALQYVRKHTTIPVPTLLEFRDEPGQPVQIVTEFVENAFPAKRLRLSPEAEGRIVQQLEGFVVQLRRLTDPDCRSFAGPPLFGVRLELSGVPIQQYKYRRYPTKSPYVLCHGDLAWHNLRIDPDTYEIKAVVDWEYAGFYPAEVESEYWRREGIGWALEGEKCDIDHVLRVLGKHMEEGGEVVQPDDSAGAASDRHQLLSTVHLPTKVTPSITAIYSQGVDVGRKRLASSLQDIAKYLKTDDKLFDCIAADIDEKCGHTLRNKVNSMSGERHTMCLINRALPTAFTTLAGNIEDTGIAFLSLRDHVSAEDGVWAELAAKEELGALPGTEEWAEEAALRAKAREMRLEQRDLADEAYKLSETKKWSAIKEVSRLRRLSSCQFATSLLRLSTAAEAFLPYLPDNDGERAASYVDSERAWVDHRADDITRNYGTGGWAVKAEDDPEDVRHVKEKFSAEWTGSEKRRTQTIREMDVRRQRAAEARIKEDQARVTERDMLRSSVQRG